jgi:hypothetical protein
MSVAGMTHSITQLPFARQFLSAVMKSSYHVSDFYEFKNFGSMEIDWSASPVTVKLQVHAENGTVVLSSTLSGILYVRAAELIVVAVARNQQFEKDCVSEMSDVPAWKSYNKKKLLKMFLMYFFVPFSIVALTLFWLFRTLRKPSRKLKTK